MLKASKIIFHLSRNLSHFQDQIKASRRYIMSTQLSALSSEIRLNPQLSKQKNTLNVGQIWIYYSGPLAHWWRSQILTRVKQIPVIFLYQIMLSVNAKILWVATQDCKFWKRHRHFLQITCKSNPIKQRNLIFLLPKLLMTDDQEGQSHQI